MITRMPVPLNIVMYKLLPGMKLETLVLVDFIFILFYFFCFIYFHLVRNIVSKGKEKNGLWGLLGL